MRSVNQYPTSFDTFAAMLVAADGMTPIVSANGMAITSVDIGAKADAAAQSGSVSALALLKWLTSQGSPILETTGSVTILSGQTTSGAFDGHGYGSYAVVMPAAFTGSTISFLVSADGATYVPLRNGSGSSVLNMGVVASVALNLPPGLSAWRYFKIVSASTEGADRVITVVARAIPTQLNLNPGTTNSDGGGLKAAVTAAGAAADSVGNATIAFPMEIGSNNQTPLAVAGWVFNGVSWDRVRGSIYGTNIVLSDSGAYSDGITRTVTGFRDAGNAQSILGVQPMLTNGAGTRDLQKNNTEGTALASAARTATTSFDIVTYNARGILLFLNVTANPGGGETLSLKLRGKDDFISGNYVDFADAGVLFTAANGTKGLVAMPGLLAADCAAGLTGKSVPMARKVNAIVTHSASGSWTYSLSYVLLV